MRGDPGRTDARPARRGPITDTGSSLFRMGDLRKGSDNLPNRTVPQTSSAAC